MEFRRELGWLLLKSFIGVSSSALAAALGIYLGKRILASDNATDRNWALARVQEIQVRTPPVVLLPSLSCLYCLYYFNIRLILFPNFLPEIKKTKIE